MLRACPLLALLALLAAAQEQPKPPPHPLRYWKTPNREAHAAYEKTLVDTVDAKALRSYHDLLASRPHPAGSEGDLHVASVIAGHFQKMGLVVEQQELHLYLAKPIDAVVEVIAPKHVPLSVREAPVDKYTADARASFGWNAFSGSGDVTANVVYANYGRKEDYARLRELGISIKGKIVIARYGGNFRGYKCKFAEADGAVGLIIYTDPKDSGWGKGLPYPEGGYANGTHIQRGSILTLDYRGDPLTPGTPATKDAKRLDPKDVAFPKIPCQPIGWDAAKQILGRMKGASVPNEWQGGLPFRYRLTGGDALKVRVMVKQERKLTKTYNVTARLQGKLYPDHVMVIGAHHDAWGFGAGDPTAGTMIVLEAARCFAEAARNGMRPNCSIVFAAWAAEEYGIMGSTEWVEAHKADLSQNCIAYLNLDMAAMGPNLRSASAPMLKSIINQCVKAETGEKLKRFGDLGGGSDHIGFYCHLGIPSASLGGGGSKGVSYHSLYDNLAWYRQVVGNDYEAGKKITRTVNRIVARITNADVLPLMPCYMIDTSRHIQAIEKRAKALGLDWDFGKFHAKVLHHQLLEGRVCAKIPDGIDKLETRKLAMLNAELRLIERRWLKMNGGLPGRKFYRSFFAAPDEDSGYAAWMLPALRRAVEHKDKAAFDKAVKSYEFILKTLRDAMNRIDKR